MVLLSTDTAAQAFILNSFFNMVSKNCKSQVKIPFFPLMFFMFSRSLILLLRWCVQGEHLVIANVGDSRAVLATNDDGGCLVPLQLTIDYKPNLPGQRAFPLASYIFLHRYITI